MTCSGSSSAVLGAIAIVAALAGPALAQSLTQQQRNAVNHLAQVMAIEIECPEYEANQLNLAVLTSGYKLDLSSPAIERMMRDIVGKSREGIRSAGNKVGCLVGWSLYGPGGQNVRDLIRRR